MKKHIHLVLMVICLQIQVLAQVTEGPLSPGTATNVSLTGASASWSNESNSLSSDDNYTSATLSSNGDFTDYLQLTNFGFSLTGSDIILGIEVEIERFGRNTKDNQIRIIKNGSVGTTDRSKPSSWSNSDSDSYTTYGSSSDLWGETWTASDINASNFGVAISASKQGGGGSSTAQVDHVRITVHYDTALPVGLLEFSGQQEEQQITLNWSTAWEHDNSHFEVQRATESIHFESLGFVPGANNSDTIISYTFTDLNPRPGYNYYRTKQFDFSGTSSFSEVIRILFEPKTKRHYLNPTVLEDQTTLSISKNPGDYILRFLSGCGKRIKQIHPQERQTRITRDAFPGPGLYAYLLFHRGKLEARGKILVK